MIHIVKSTQIQKNEKNQTKGRNKTLLKEEDRFFCVVFFFFVFSGVFTDKAFVFASPGVNFKKKLSNSLDSRFPFNSANLAVFLARMFSIVS